MKRKRQPQKSTKKIVPADEFRRFNKNEGHPSYVVGKQGRQLIHFKMTSQPKTRGKKNIELNGNPEPGNKEKSHIRIPAQKDHKSDFGSSLPDWEMSAENKKRIEPYMPKLDNKKKKR